MYTALSAYHVKDSFAGATQCLMHAHSLPHCKSPCEKQSLAEAIHGHLQTLNQLCIMALAIRMLQFCPESMSMVMLWASEPHVHRGC